MQIQGSQQVDKVLNLTGEKFKHLDLTNMYMPPLLSLRLGSWLLLPEYETVPASVVKNISASHMFLQ
ncbi:hypothetical protein SRHO_G00258440 [Serrasalmus rhombeus]